MAQRLQARINKKGQLQIPARIRKHFNMQSYQFQELELLEDRIIIYPAPDIDKVRSELKDNLHNKGFSDEKLREMAQWQTVGDLNRTHKEWLDKETQYHGKLH